MKRSHKHQAEPSKLTEFRTSRPNAQWDEFRNEDPGGYYDVVGQLREDQKGLCAYCEIELSDNNRQVAHFHPKSDKSNTEINWAFVWSNLWLCCKGGTQTWLPNAREYMPPLPANRSCDENKGSTILSGLILEPCQVPLFPRIFKFEVQTNSVEIIPDEDECRAAQIDLKIATRTICELNLNCTRLARARLDVFKIVEREITAARKDGATNLAATQIPAKWLSRQSNGNYRAFFTLLRWRLRDAGEAYLSQTGYAG